MSLDRYVQLMCERDHFAKMLENGGNARLSPETLERLIARLDADIAVVWERVRLEFEQQEAQDHVSRQR